jgi:hypothetical protein
MSIPPVYDPFVPEQPDDFLATSQGEMLDNFELLQKYFSVNHVPMPTALSPQANAGEHTIIQLIEQLKPFQTNAQQISVYCKDSLDAVGNRDQTDQMFLRYQSNGTEVQMTNYQIYTIEPGNGQTSFFTFLPGKILIYFGSFTTLPNGILTLTPPVAKNIMGMTICPNGATNFKPNVSLIKSPEDFITGIVMKNSVLGGFQSNCFYCILANI